MGLQTMLGQPIAWVNNQFRQYVYDVSTVLGRNISIGNNNLTVAFEAAAAYGLNVSARPDMEFVEGVSVVILPVNFRMACWISGHFLV